MVQETRVQFQVKSYQRLKKMVLDASLLNTQYYKVWIKGKVEHAPLYHGVAANEKSAFGHPRLWSPTLLIHI